MDAKEMLQIDIDNLDNAYYEIEKALNNLKDVEEFSNIQYQELHNIAENINDLKIEKEIDLERLEEIA